ncbi:MAG: tetratricopeptide repeat protein [Anaerolineae bacterium]|nr:tetratricopeptide repeat protein [Anaerolineae bacterium]
MQKMRTAAFLVLFLAVLLAGGPGASRQVIAQDGGPELAHLVLDVINDGDARINRMDWDVNAFAPLFPATSVRESDYIDISGRTTLTILCADLTLIEQRGSEVPRCQPYPAVAAFYYVDDPSWSGPDAPVTVVVSSPDAAGIPPEVRNPSAYSLDPLTDDEMAQVAGAVGTITGLGVSPEAQAFALSSYYRGQGMIFDSLAALLVLPDLGCSERRPFVDPPAGIERPLVQSPALYVRLGEIFQVLGQNEDALRYYRCATELAETVGDPANTALAYARQANLMEDSEQATQFYQVAIDNYMSLGALASANTMLEICGSRNCTLPY